MKRRNVDLPNYSSLHHWLRYHFGRADHCDLCGKVRKESDWKNSFEWSNRTGIYEKYTWHWWQLCRKCHRLYDYFFLDDKKRKHGTLAMFTMEKCRCVKCKRGAKRRRAAWPSEVKKQGLVKKMRRSTIEKAIEIIRETWPEKFNPRRDEAIASLRKLNQRP